MKITSFNPLIVSGKRGDYQKLFEEKVREQIESGKGTQFDPVFADIMLHMMDEDTEYKMREL